MIEKVVITVGSLFLGALLAWFFNWIAHPEKKAILLAPLILPGLIWFGISGQLKEVSGPGGFQVTFAAEAKAPVLNFTERGALRPVFEPMPVMVQMALPVPPEFVSEPIAKQSDAVLMGDKSRRIFYWFTYGKVDPAALLDAIEFVGRDVATDASSEFLVFGPEVGVVDCYVPDTDFLQKREELAKTLRALAAMPAEQRRAFLGDSEICAKPFGENLPAVDALRRLDDARHDEAIVVNESNGYLGIAFRDTIVSALVTSLIEALVKSD
jgi:hypothetical protein